VISRHNFAVLTGLALPPRAARKILAALIINGAPAERRSRSSDSAFSRFWSPPNAVAAATTPLHTVPVSTASRDGDGGQFFNRARYLANRRCSEFHVGKVFGSREIAGFFYDAFHRMSQTPPPPPPSLRVQILPTTWAFARAKLRARVLNL